ncbi:hypothetical protein [Arsenophonus endosymbiont of Bemisia tabaci]|uniref:hypothetical protein n=1 Tax=Arsenophonus endosymbiont of Bemisia tabaci TaxID=536059 RepID=UPI0015F4EE3A|nr:hypothetical protein [Arsenophonus endosymbiont of Bemisia tabaci]CAA2931286.1 hypothetical protein ARSQ2_02440 [Arsenophonus endosymbiont of Bemisia tabaci Q2]
MNWIDCRVRLPDIVTIKYLFYNNNTKGQLVGIDLGNSHFHYSDCCQGIQKTCTASH